jgi:hypothetical protein
MTETTAPTLPTQADEEYESKKGGLLSDSPIHLWKRIQTTKGHIAEYNRLIEWYKELIIQAEHRLEYLESNVDSNTFMPATIAEEEEEESND